MINVILADHEGIFRIGMVGALAAEDDIRIVGQPATPAQLVRGIKNFRPHVVVLSSTFLVWVDDIREACDRQRAAILLLRDQGASEVVGFSEDFQGVIDRSADERTVVEHVRQLARGGRVIRLNSVGGQARASDMIGLRVSRRLTGQETAIIAYVVRGFKNREIAHRVGATEHAVKNALRRIFDKIGVYGRLELALYVLHHRIVIAAPEEVFPEARRVALFAPVRNWDAGRSPSIN